MTEQLREITVVANKGAAQTIIPVPLNEEGKVTWGNLQELFSEYGVCYDADYTKAVDGTTVTELGPDESIVSGDMVFLFPRETKGGSGRNKGTDYRSELFETVRQLVKANGKAAKDFFNKPRNYSQLTTPELERKVKEFQRGEAAKTEDVVETENAIERSKELLNYHKTILQEILTRFSEFREELEELLSNWNSIDKDNPTEDLAPTSMDPVQQEYLRIQRLVGGKDQDEYEEDDDDWDD